MQAETSTSEAGEPPAGNPLSTLKQFKSAGRSYWHNVAESDWNDWRWQLKHRITTVEQLQKFLPTLTPGGYCGGGATGQPQAGAGHHALFFQPD